MKKSNSISSVKKNDLKLTATEQSSILDTLHDGVTAYEISREKQISLRTLYNYLDQNPKFKDQFLKAGIHYK